MISTVKTAEYILTTHISNFSGFLQLFAGYNAWFG
jgi:hypothetical protein